MRVNESHQSPCWISCLFLPSNDTQAVFLASGDKVICFRREEEKHTVKVCLQCYVYYDYITQLL